MLHTAPRFAQRSGTCAARGRWLCSISDGSTFASAADHTSWLQAEAALPAGFRVGTHTLQFHPCEVPGGGPPQSMTVTLLLPDAPTPSFAATFTRNAFPGAPVVLGRALLEEQDHLAGIVVNNRISNVRAPVGIAAAREVCEAVSTLPVPEMVDAVPHAVATLQSGSILPAARGIMTTDRYPKVRRCPVPGGGSVVGIAKGAGMIEPNMATMLSFIATDVAVPRDALQRMLSDAVHDTFNCISVDSDTSTSDTVVAMSSNVLPPPPEGDAALQAALREVCAGLAHDVVRNGEGVEHVMAVTVTGAPSTSVARGVGKSVVNSPLFKCAVAGEDANVGRLVCAIGKYMGSVPGIDDEVVAALPHTLTLSMGGVPLYSNGEFTLTPDGEARLDAHMRAAAMNHADAFPAHDRVVAVTVNLGAGTAHAHVFGADLTSEYVVVNADYRS